MAKKDERTRNWTFIVYPESAPQNWRDIIDEEHIEWVESPLHDLDINPDGSTKKPHIHILVLYSGNKSFEQIKELTDRLNAPIPQKCANAKGLVRYMAHLDNPEKFQYDKNRIVGHGGIDVNDFFKATNTDRHVLIQQMIRYIKANKITEFTDLMDYASENEYDWFAVLCDNSAMVINMYIQSNRHQLKQATTKKQIISEVTGEVLNVSDTVDSSKIDKLDYEMEIEE